MTKDEIIAAIAEKEIQMVILQSDVNQMLLDLAAFLPWQIGDVIKTGKGIYQIQKCVADSDGSPRKLWVRKQLKNKDFGEVRPLYSWNIRDAEIISRAADAQETK